MGDTVREAAATLASLLSASTTIDDDVNSKCDGRRLSSLPKYNKSNECNKSPGEKSSTNWHAILSSKEQGDDWEYHYSKLQQYEQTHQNVLVPRDGTHDDLHDWIKMQKAKSAYLHPEQVSALQIIGVLPTKLSHDIAYTNPPIPPRRKKVELVKKQKEQNQKENTKVIKKKRVAAPNPYSNVHKSAREKSKVSRAERAKRRLGHFKTAFISPR